MTQRDRVDGLHMHLTNQYGTTVNPYTLEAELRPDDSGNLDDLADEYATEGRIDYPGASA